MLQSQLTTKPPQLYSNTKASQTLIPSLPQLQLPATNDTAFPQNLNKKLRSLNSDQYPTLVPFKVDSNLVYTSKTQQTPQTPQ
ncbi:hypothetical protein AHAS_Ahas01G0320800 [Arachis hypogaea]